MVTTKMKESPPETLDFAGWFPSRITEKPPSTVSVVIADDEEYFADLVKDLLELDHPNLFSINTYKDGTEAWKEIRKGHTNIALLDNYMPGIDGLTLARKIHQELSDSTAPRVIIMTTYPQGVMEEPRIPGILRTDDFTCYQAAIEKRSAATLVLEKDPSAILQTTGFLAHVLLQSRLRSYGQTPPVR